MKTIVYHRDLPEAMSLIGKIVKGQRSGTYDAANSIIGRVVSVREVISDYTDGSWTEVLVDIDRHGTVTPVPFGSVSLIQENQ